MDEADKGWLMIMIGVSGWTFLLVPAHPGCPRQMHWSWWLLDFCGIWPVNNSGNDFVSVIFHKMLMCGTCLFQEWLQIGEEKLKFVEVLLLFSLLMVVITFFFVFFHILIYLFILLYFIFLEEICSLLRNTMKCISSYLNSLRMSC